MIAEVVGATGWSWDDALDGLTVPRFIALRSEWRRRPPAHWSLAALIRRDGSETTSTNRPPSIAELQGAFG